MHEAPSRLIGPIVFQENLEEILGEGWDKTQECRPYIGLSRSSRLWEVCSHRYSQSILHAVRVVSLQIMIISFFVSACIAGSTPTPKTSQSEACEDLGPAIANPQQSLPATKLFVFIHGWGGTKEQETWGCFLKFMKNNQRLSGYAIESYGYPTSVFGHSPSIDEVSGNFEQWLMNCCSQFQSYILVGHSMGGIVAKQYILNMLHRGQAADLKVELVFFIATPHTGAALAKWASYVPLIASAQIRALTGVNEGLLQTQLRDWNSHVLNADDRLPASQKKWIKPIIIFGTNDQVVDKASAIDRFPLAIPVFKGHMDIVKPIRSDDDVVQSVIHHTLRAYSNGP